MGNLYKGYSVNFAGFNSYYKASTRTDHAKYLGLFQQCFVYQMNLAKCPQGLYSNTINLVEKKMTTLGTKTRTAMLSGGAPAGAAKSIIESFKRWFKATYGD